MPKDREGTEMAGHCSGHAHTALVDLKDKHDHSKTILTCSIIFPLPNNTSFRRAELGEFDKCTSERVYILNSAAAFFLRRLQHHCTILFRFGLELEEYE